MTVRAKWCRRPPCAVATTSPAAGRPALSTRSLLTRTRHRRPGGRTRAAARRSRPPQRAQPATEPLASLLWSSSSRSNHPTNLGRTARTSSAASPYRVSGQRSSRTSCTSWAAPVRAIECQRSRMPVSAVTFPRHVRATTGVHGATGCTGPNSLPVTRLDAPTLTLWAPVRRSRGGPADRRAFDGGASNSRVRRWTV